MRRFLAPTLIPAVILTILPAMLLGCPRRGAGPTPAPAVAPASASSQAGTAPDPTPLTAPELAHSLTADGRVTLRNVYFITAEATLIPEATEAMLEVLTVLRANPQLHVEIGVHSDPQGSSAYNQKMSAERAAAMVEWFAGQGIDPTRLTPVGYGESQLLPCGDSPECYAQCRRIELRVIPAH